MKNVLISAILLISTIFILSGCKTVEEIDGRAGLNANQRVIFETLEGNAGKILNELIKRDLSETGLPFMELYPSQGFGILANSSRILTYKDVEAYYIDGVITNDIEDKSDSMIECNKNNGTCSIFLSLKTPATQEFFNLYIDADAEKRAEYEKSLANFAYNGYFGSQINKRKEYTKCVKSGHVGC